MFISSDCSENTILPKLSVNALIRVCLTLEEGRLAHTLVTHHQYFELEMIVLRLHGSYINISYFCS